MFSTDFNRSCAVFALVAFFFAGCGRFGGQPRAGSSPTPATSDELSAGLPFSAAEPSEYSAEIVVTAGGGARRTFVARKGERRRIDFDFGTPAQRTLLRTDREYLLDPARKSYVVVSSPSPGPADEWSEFLTTEKLAAGARGAKFEKLEQSPYPLSTFRVVLGDGAEEIVSYDDVAGVIVKQEMFAVENGLKTLVYTFELKDFKTAADDGLFAVPADYRLAR